MATSSKRAVKRGKAKADKAAEKAAEKKAVFNPAIRRDKVINAAFSEYENTQTGAGPLLTLMDKIVRRFAASDYDAHPKYGEYLQSREAAIRMKERRANRGVVSARDKKGVAASQFNSVLKLAKMAGGLKAWNMIVERTTNWTNAKELSVKVREYFAGKGKVKAHNAFPSPKKMDSILAQVKRDKYGTASGKSTGTTSGSKSSVSTLLKRIEDALKKLKPKVKRAGVDKSVASIANAIGAIRLATVTVKTGKSGKRAVTLKGDNLVAYEKFIAAQKKRAA